MHSNFSVKYDSRQVSGGEKAFFSDRRDPHTFIKKPKLITYCQGLSRTAKELYEILVDYGRNGLIFPAIATLADDMGLSIRQVARLVAELRAAGLIVTQRTGRSNNYYLVELTPNLVNLISRARSGQVEQLTTGPSQSQPLIASLTLSPQEADSQPLPQERSQAQAALDTGVITGSRRPSESESQPAQPALTTTMTDQQANQSRAVIFGSSDMPKMADKEESLNHVCETPYPLKVQIGEGKVPDQRGGISPKQTGCTDQRAKSAQAEAKEYDHKGYAALIKMSFSQAMARRLVETVERNRPGQAEDYITSWITYAQAHATTNPAGYVKTVLADNAQLPNPRPAAQLHKPDRKPRGGHQPVDLTRWAKYLSQTDTDNPERIHEFGTQAQPEPEPLAVNPTSDQPAQSIDRKRYLRYSLEDFDPQVAARLRRLEIEGDTIKAIFRGSGEVQLDGWLNQARIYYPDVIRVKVETSLGV